ncbi:Integrase core domain protein [Mycobacterium marinum]|nr:Integrase core domain protein [Mycobacterium marinum]
MHTAIDDYTRLAYSEVLPDEKDPTCAGFLHRALAWFAAHSVRVRRLLTDNALVYRHGTDWGFRPGSLNADSVSPAVPGPTAKQNVSTGP